MSGPAATTLDPAWRRCAWRGSLASVVLFALYLAASLVAPAQIGALPPAILALAALVAFLSTEAALHKSPPRWHGLWIELLLWVPLGSVFIAVAALVGWPRVGISNDELRERVESFAAPVAETPAWGAWDLAARWLDEPGAAPLELEPARRAIEDALAVGTQVSPYTLGPAADRGLLDEWLCADAEVAAAAQRLLTRSTPIDHPDQKRHLVRQLELAGALTADARDALARRALAAWDLEHEFASPNRLLALVRFLELLERPERSGELAADAAELLRRSWISGAIVEHTLVGSDGAAFRAYPNHASPLHPDLAATLAALGLMARFGAPDDLDLRALRRHLMGQARRYAGLDWTLYRARAAIGLAQLERCFPALREGDGLWRPTDQTLWTLAAVIIAAAGLTWVRRACRTLSAPEGASAT